MSIHYEMRVRKIFSRLTFKQDIKLNRSIAIVRFAETVKWNRNGC